MKYLYPIKNLKVESWIKWWLYRKAKNSGGILSELFSGTEITINNTLEKPFKVFNIKGNSVQDGTPAPDNEVPIYSAGENGSITEKIQSKNFLEITEDTLLFRCTYVSGVNTDEYKVLCTGNDMYINEVQAEGASYAKPRNGNLIHCKYGETIYYDTGSTSIASNYFTEFDENLISLGYYRKASSKGSYTPTNSECKYITFRFGAGGASVIGNTYTLAPIISKEPIISYTPHQEQTYTIPTQQPMRSIGDVRDEFDRENKLERHPIQLLDLSNVTFRMPLTDDKNAVFCNLSNTTICDYKSDTLPFLSEYFAWKGKAVGFANALDYGVGLYSYIEVKTGHKYLYFVVPLSIASSVEEFKELVSNNNIKVQYISETPTELPCTAEQISILENRPKSYTEQTNIYSEDETPAFVEAQSYVKKGE